MARQTATTTTTVPESTPPSGYPGGGSGGTGSGTPDEEDRLGDGYVNSTTSPSFDIWAGGADGPGYGPDDVFAPYSWSPAQILDLQRRLRAGGWIRGSISQPGVWNDEAQDAFRDLLVYANGTGSTWQAMLGESIMTRGAGGAGAGGLGGGGGSSYAPLTIQLPNEQDVRRSVEGLFREMTDVDGGEDFYQRVTDQYMDHLRNIQLADYEAQRRRDTRDQDNGRAPGGTIVQEDPVTLETFAEDLIEKERPKQVKNARIGDAEESFMDVMTRSYG